MRLALVKEVEVKNLASLENAIKFFHSAATAHQRIRLSLHKDTKRSGSGAFLNDKRLGKLLKSIQCAEGRGVHIVSLILDLCAIQGGVTLATMDLMGRWIGFKHLIVTSSTFQVDRARANATTRYLAGLVGRARQLTSVLCFGIVFQGKQQDFADLAAAFSKHSNLSTVRFPACAIASKARSATTTVNPFLRALIRLPKLRVLELACWGVLLQGRDKASLLSRDLLKQLYGHPKLQRLHMERSPCDWGVSSPHQQPHCSFGRGGDTIAAISQSKTLQALTLTLTSPREECPQLALIIRNNQSLTTLLVDVKPCHDDRPMALVVDALKTNTTLKRLSFVFGATAAKKFSKSIQNAFVSVLDKHNWTLRYLQFAGGCRSGSQSQARRGDSAEEATMQKIKFLVKLNKLGRKALLENANSSRAQWIGTLDSCGGDLDSIYYFLSMKPTLCQAGLLEAIAVQRQRKRRRLK